MQEAAAKFTKMQTTATAKANAVSQAHSGAPDIRLAGWHIMTVAAVKLKYIANLFRTGKPENIATAYPYTPSNNPFISRLSALCNLYYPHGDFNNDYSALSRN